MPQVNVTIAGRAYRMACGEGEEEHLAALARRLDAKIGALRGAFGEIGDQRITMMAAITIADELSEAEQRIATLEGEVKALAAERRAQDRQSAALAEQLAVAIDGVATQIDRIASDLSAEGRP